MLNYFDRYATNAMDTNDVYRALNEDRPGYCSGEAADWYRRERCYNLKPADKNAFFPHKKKKKRSSISGSISGRTRRLQAEGVK